MTSELLVCWKCGRGLDDVPLPLSRYAECPGCRAELYVCRMCRFYDTRVAESCREPMADEVKDKIRANFCDFLQPAPGAYQGSDEASGSGANAALAMLFGDESGTGDPHEDASEDPANALRDLFDAPKRREP